MEIFHEPNSRFENKKFIIPIEAPQNFQQCPNKSKGAEKKKNEKNL